MVQCIHITFEIGKLAALLHDYKNRLITQAMQLRNEHNITSIWLTIRMNYGNITDYKYITIVEAIQKINDCIYHHLKNSIAETSYGIIPVEIVEIEPLKFLRGSMQSPTQLDEFIKGR